jgi:hypothetical protein
VRNVAKVDLALLLAYIVECLGAISYMLSNLCMYIPVSMNLMSFKHCRCDVAVVFNFFIKCSIC